MIRFSQGREIPNEEKEKKSQQSVIEPEKKT